MTSRALQQFLSVEEYLEGELRRPVKHEYVAGQIFAMVGVSRDHNRIALNLFKLLEAHLYGGPCQIYVAEVKVRVEKADAFYYPDIAVTCDASDTEKYYLTHPCLIVEVLSPSTEGIDRREKLMAYQQLESLQEYILVSQEKERVDVYRKDEEGKWWLDTYAEKEEFQLDSVGLKVTMDAIYEDVGYEDVGNDDRRKRR